ncbi:MAG TPA: hypothetical protein VHZ09_07175 [Acidobacteriaceae bacterium]|jgi:hypothetical protein|nr:hypothetical protein [Acidobacteriaceae bacterium]
MKRKNSPLHTFLPVLLLLGFLSAVPQRAHAQSPTEIVRKVVNNELEADAQDHSTWMYKDAYKSPDKNVVRIFIQTHQGNLSELIEDNGHPPTAAEHQADLDKTHQMLTDPAYRARLRRNEQHDGQQALDLMKMLPDAFVWTITNRQNGDITLSFHPNPSFTPPSMSAKVLAAMSGDIVVAENKMRLKVIDGHLDQPVDFAWGLLGKINAGGTFRVVRTEVAPDEWQVTQTHVHISGHALFFKTIGDQEDEITSDYHRVPGDTTLQKAADMLKDGAVARELGIPEPHFG